MSRSRSTFGPSARPRAADRRSSTRGTTASRAVARASLSAAGGVPGGDGGMIARPLVRWLVSFAGVWIAWGALLVAVPVLGTDDPGPALTRALVRCGVWVGAVALY